MDIRRGMSENKKRKKPGRKVNKNEPHLTKALVQCVAILFLFLFRFARYRKWQKFATINFSSWMCAACGLSYFIGGLHTITPKADILFSTHTHTQTKYTTSLCDDIHTYFGYLLRFLYFAPINNIKFPLLLLSQLRCCC